MKAAVRTRYGPPDVVHVDEVPTPEPGPAELLVRVHATTVNRTDCAYRSGTPFVIRFGTGFPAPRTAVLGTEFAGVVERVGAEVTEFATGDRVFGYVEGRFGAHAEHITVPERGSVAVVPPGIGFTEAAAATEGAHYALAMARVARTRPGQRVLVLGASGGIGSAAVQLLMAGGVTVTAATRGALDRVAGLGADRVVEAAADAVPDDGTRYDAVFDAVGKSSFGRYRSRLTRRGIYTSSELGPKGQNIPLSVLSPLSPGRRVRFPFPLHDQAMIRRLAGLLADGRLRSLIDRHYPLDRIVEAYRYVESGQKIGNVVVDVVP
ncbi:NAD(P)-dependent alcohol dehydrogenase [Blastococcus goldschmidtiae]|uniref:NAD(P)-dependent alcohol dehydrogenase n=1 Tax=Blastococcus goldschmidtiae TaxID=3075546 RepID=A0ABU2KCB5_9ACTN|nr:NAD(P)-dependent alcohol dehydrogenase [Blastococcus sp. DSM 46792]MDT0277834.1 NAD(P)-dependent alcohol dehydrogenase [Blastococcus sp. DSM 46792]